MNLFLHNISDITGESLISPNDSLIPSPETRYDYIFASPPSGKKSSIESFLNVLSQLKK